MGVSVTLSDNPVPLLSNNINLEKDANFFRNLTMEGSSQKTSIFDIQPGTSTKSLVPSPTTWYAIWMSPLLVYLVSGIMDGVLINFNPGESNIRTKL
jgi:hypothetical protein